MAQAVVTGATSGIGQAIALALQAAGHEVIALGRNRAALAALTAAGLRGIAVDVTDAAALDGALAGRAPGILATKAAVGGFAQALRLDMAPHGVRVTEIVAGRVETGLYKDLLSPEARAAMYAGHSAVQPQDVAAMVLAVLALPQSVDVARFDILPTHQATATGASNKDK